MLLVHTYIIWLTGVDGGNISVQQNKSKKKIDPCTYRPSKQEKSNANDASILLKEVSKEYQCLHEGETFDVEDLEKMFTANDLKDIHLLVIGLLFSRKKDMKTGRKYTFLYLINVDGIVQLRM